MPIVSANPTSRAKQLYATCLGTLSFSLGGDVINGFRSRKDRALLLYLILERTRRHRRDALQALLWPYYAPESARTNLRRSLANIRKALGSARELLVTSRQEVSLDPDFPIECDLWHYERLSNRMVDEAALRQAVDLYQGHFLADFHVDDVDTFESWVAGRRALMQQLHKDTLNRLANFHLESGNALEALSIAEKLVAFDDLDEESHQLLLQTLGHLGRRADVSRHLQQITDLLQTELGVAPLPATMAVADAALAGTSAPTVLATKVAVRPTLIHTHNLPHDTLPFIGRETEISRLVDLLQTDDCRLLTLLAPGGMGKTRLAIATGRRLVEQDSSYFKRGVWLAELAGVDQPAGLPAAIAAALPFEPTQGKPLDQQVVDFLREKSLLLILDNFEQLLAGSGWLSDILAAAPDVRFLVTSRERLGLVGETLYELGGLPLPADDNPESVAASESGALFIAYARRMRDDRFDSTAVASAVATICRLTGGMPLGLVLAAAWLDVLAVTEVADELRADLQLLEADLADLPDRQRSVATVFEQTWVRLDENEQRWLAGLSVFRGGFTRAAAQAILDLSLRGLKRLHGRALLTNDESGRYHLHELLRQLAARKLEADPAWARSVAGRHSAYFLQQAASFQAAVKGGALADDLQRLDADQDNVIAAWEWAVAHKHWGRIERSVVGLDIYLDLRLNEDVGRRVFDPLLKRLKEEGESHLYLLLRTLYLGLRTSKERALAIPKLLEELDRLDPDASWHHRPLILRTLGAQLFESDRHAALRLSETAIETAKAYGNTVQLAAAGRIRGSQLHMLGRFAEARAQFEEILELSSSHGNRLQQAFVLANLASLDWYQMRPEVALARLDKSKFILEELNLRALTVFLRPSRAWSHHIAGRFETAYESDLSTLAQQQEQGLDISHTLFRLAKWSHHLGEYERALKHADDSSRAAEAEDSRAWPIGIRGAIALVRGDVAGALDIFQPYCQMLANLGGAGQPDELSHGQSRLAMAQIALGDAAAATENIGAALAITLQTRSFKVQGALAAAALHVLHHGNAVRSLEIYTVTCQQPRARKSRWFADVAGDRIHATAQTLPAAEREAIIQRASETDFWSFVEDVAAGFPRPTDIVSS